jgi:glutamate---cysteine ligase / carboxylate-amine ligase
MKLRTVGVEEEFLLVDAAGVPQPAGAQVVPGKGTHQLRSGAAVENRPDRPAAMGGLEHELQQEQAETGTRPRTRLADLRADLVQRRRELSQAAAGHGVQIAALATSPMPVEPTATEDPRYLRIMREYAVTAREQLTCGCHVHVGINSRAEGVAVINAIQPWLPVIIAVSANSPFWQGTDTEYASYRRMVWDRWPGSGATAPFGDEHDYDRTVADLVRSKVLLDDAMVYFDARLSAKYPTVEVRVADVCTDPDDAVLVAALCRGLVDSAARAAQDGAPWPSARVELLRGATWRAARSGLDGDLVDPLTGAAVPALERLDQLVDRIRPSLQAHDDLETVQTAVHRLAQQGNGASRQRADYARRNELQDVVLAAARRTTA